MFKCTGEGKRNSSTLLTSTVLHGGTTQSQRKAPWPTVSPRGYGYRSEHPGHYGDISKEARCSLTLSQVLSFKTGRIKMCWERGIWDS